MTYLLDTSTVVNFLRGNTSTKNLLIQLSEQGSFAISVITYGELLYGAHRSGVYKKESERISSLVDDFCITVLPMTQEVMECFAAAKYALERNGSKLDDFDLLIGATAVVHHCSLITDNIKHFKKFPTIVLG